MELERIEPEQAKALLDTDEGYVYLDVRSVEEFAAGHVPGAKNIPWAHRNPDGPGMLPNPEFVEQVEQEFRKDAKLVVACLRGGRSMKAALMLIADGYTNVVDMRGGYDGEINASGAIVFDGWARRGLPTTTE